MGKNSVITLLSISLILALVLSANTCSRKNQEIDRYRNNVEAMKDSIKTVVTKNGSLASELKSILATSEEIKKENFLKDEEINNLSKELKEVKFALSVKQTVRIDTIIIPMDEKGEVKTDTYSFSYFLNNHKRELYDFKANTKLSIVAGIKQERKGWFKKELTPTVLIQSSNKNVTIEKAVSQQTFEVKDNSYKWALPVGFVLGYLIAK